MMHRLEKVMLFRTDGYFVRAGDCGSENGIAASGDIGDYRHEAYIT